MYYAVRYRLSEDPKLLTTGEIPETGSTAVAVAPDSRVVAISVDTSLFIFSSSSGDMMEKLVDVHGGILLQLTNCASCSLSISQMWCRVCAGTQPVSTWCQLETATDTSECGTTTLGEGCTSPR